MASKEVQITLSEEELEWVYSLILKEEVLITYGKTPVSEDMMRTYHDIATPLSLRLKEAYRAMKGSQQGGGM